MELVHLRTFLAVVEHRGFRRAARRLYLSEPAVSRQVAALERSVGVPLLVRSTAGVEPTPAGRVLVARAQRLLDESDAAVRAARCEGLTGELVMGIAPAGIGELTAPLLRHLARAMPGLRLRPYEFTMLDWAARPGPDVDLMLTHDPFDEDGCRVTVLLTESSAIAVPRGYPEADACRLSLDEALELPYARISSRVPATFSRFWTMHEQRGGLVADFRGPPACEPADAPRLVIRGEGCAFGTPFTARYYRCPIPLTPVDGAPAVRTVLLSARSDRRPLVDAVHREVAWVARRIGPLVLPELA